MANLVVRNLDRSIVEALKKRAVRHRRSAEAEHRAILESALARTRRKTFAQALAEMPNVGSESRNGDDFRKTRVRVLNPFS